MEENKEQLVLINKYLDTSDSIEELIMLIDIRHKPTEDDIMMYEYLKHYNIPVIVCCTKIDKVKKNCFDKNVNIISKALNVKKEELILFSSVTKAGKQEIFNKLINVLDIR